MPRRSRPAIVEIGARSRKLDAGLRRAREKLGRFGKRATTKLKKQFKSVGSTLKLAIGGSVAAALVQSARSVRGFEDRLQRLSSQANIGAKAVIELRNRIRTLSSDSGIAADAILDGAAAIVSLSGPAALTAEKLDLLTKAASATGTSTMDLAGVMFSLQRNFGIVDPKELEMALNAITKGGNEASIEIKEMSSLLTSVAPTFTNFGIKGAEGVAILTAGLQQMRGGFGSAAEAVTGMQGLMDELVAKAGRLKKLGVDVYIGKGDDKRLQNLRKTILQIEKANIDPELLAKIFRRKEGRKALQQLVEFGGEWDGMIDTMMTVDEISRQYTHRQESDVGRMDRAWERMKNRIAAVFTPDKIDKFASAMEKLAEAVAWMADNMRQTAAILIAMKLSPALLALIKWKAGGGMAAVGAGAAPSARAAAGRGLGAGAGAAAGAGIGVAGHVRKAARGGDVGSGRKRVEARRAELKTRGPAPAPARGGGVGMGLGLAVTAYQAWTGEHREELRAREEARKGRQSSLAELEAQGKVRSARATRDLKLEGGEEIETKAYLIRGEEERAQEFSPLKMLMAMAESARFEKAYEDRRAGRIPIDVNIVIDDRGMWKANLKKLRGGAE